VAGRRSPIYNRQSKTTNLERRSPRLCAGPATAQSRFHSALLSDSRNDAGSLPVYRAANHFSLARLDIMRGFGYKYVMAAVCTESIPLVGGIASGVVRERKTGQVRSPRTVMPRA
jgi:hypothetical protein